MHKGRSCWAQQIARTRNVIAQNAMKYGRPTTVTPHCSRSKSNDIPVPAAGGIQIMTYSHVYAVFGEKIGSPQNGPGPPAPYPNLRVRNVMLRCVSTAILLAMQNFSILASVAPVPQKYSKCGFSHNGPCLPPMGTTQPIFMVLATLATPACCKSQPLWPYGLQITSSLRNFRFP